LLFKGARGIPFVMADVVGMGTSCDSNTSTLAEATTDEIAEQIRVSRIVATSEGGILLKFGPDLLKPLLTNESRYLANHNPVGLGNGNRTLMLSSNWL
jgi:hypothetical protein